MINSNLKPSSIETFDFRTFGEFRREHKYDLSVGHVVLEYAARHGAKTVSRHKSAPVKVDDGFRNGLHRNNIYGPPLCSRVLYKLNVLIMDTLGSVSASFLAGFTVSSARLAYLDICDGCTTVTRMFQTQLFVNIVGNVFSVTFMMLSAFNMLMSDGTNTIRITLYFLYDSLMRTLQMYFIIDACHTTVEQVNYVDVGAASVTRLRARIPRPRARPSWQCNTPSKFQHDSASFCFIRLHVFYIYICIITNVVLIS